MEESKEHHAAAKWRRRIALLLAIGTALGLIVSFSLFFLGYVNDVWLVRGIVGGIIAFLVALILFRLPVDMLRYEPNRARKLAGLSFIGLGAFAGLLIGFFGAGFLLMAILGGPIPGGVIGDAFLIFAWIVAPIIGGFIGYLVFKRTKYSNPSFYSGYA